MKKFTFLIVALLAIVGYANAAVDASIATKKVTAINAAATSIDTDAWYILYNQARGCYVSEETTEFRMRATSSFETPVAAADKAGYLFQFEAVEGAENQYYIKSGNGLYFTINQGSSTVSTTPVAYTIAQIGDNAGHFYGQMVSDGRVLDGNAEGGTLAGWDTTVPTGTGGNNDYQFLPVAMEDVSYIVVTYNFIYNGEAKYTQTSTVEEGAAFPDYTVTLPYGVTAAEKPATTVTAENATQDIELTIGTLPFTYTDSYNSITDANWYYLKFHANSNRYLYYNSELTYLDATKTTVDYSNKNAYTWAFVGNPFDGFAIVNKAAGETMVLSSAAEPTTDKEYPVMTAKDEVTGNTVWDITSSTHGTNGFFAAYDGTNKRLNLQDDKVCYWLDGADAGSTFTAITIADGDAATIADFKEHAISGLGYVGGYTADKVNDINAISTYEDMIAFQEANTPITFDENKYYQIQNVFRTTFITAANNARTLAENTNAVNQLWQVEASNGAYLIKSVNGGYMQAVGENALAETGAELNIASFVDGYGQFAIKSGNNMLAGINNTTLGTWWNGSFDGDMAYRFIETDEFNVTVNEFASICLPFAAATTEDVTVYAIEETNTTHAIFTEKTDIAANEGAILAGNGTFTFKIQETATSDWTKNMLEGTTTNAYIAANAYILANVDLTEDDVENPVIGLYKAALDCDETGAEGTTHFLNNANKAYLVVPGANSAIQYFALNFGGGTTGIEGVEAEGAVSGKIYDITGREVKAITAPGIYIVNGAKVVVK